MNKSKEIVDKLIGVNLLEAEETLLNDFIEKLNDNDLEYEMAGKSAQGINIVKVFSYDGTPMYVTKDIKMSDDRLNCYVKLTNAKRVNNITGRLHIIDIVNGLDRK